ncbi:MAG: gliding motility-associated C-terminal domain-containing protein [Bacteroidales bacterium]|jgi:gliding motility-associated-like protein|nr:gliding motility-associated C-terminal domain-containing protein [Bacteroidales bacterium]MDD4640905.1 gliding motility-associated C-terminal domain-containing protein [Bacteroidales bacterium]
MYRKGLLKYLVFTFIFIFNQSADAAFTAVGGLNGQAYEYIPAAATGLEKVFIFNGLQQAELRYNTEDPINWNWYRYQTGAEDAQAVPAADVTVESGATVLKNPGAYGYYVTKGDQIKALYIIDYSAHTLNYTRLSTVDNAEDICSSLQLVVEGTQEDLVYYALSGSPARKTVDRIHSLSWTDLEWDEEKEQYLLIDKNTSKEGFLSGFIVDAPLQNTRFRLEGDQFADYFGLNAQNIEKDYQAVHVSTHAKAVPEEKERADNELGTGSAGSLTGSAPFKLDFYSHVNPASRYTEWYIYTTPGSREEYLRRTETDINYTFNQAGSFEVKLIASNSVCKDSAIFTIRVTESSLDCPNFFSPRSTPGDNDEFKVAYQSLIKFQGRILNRWGNVLFEWTDPSLGWDGTYKGKAVSPGVYFYIISATGSDGIEYRKKGDINLLE